MSGFFRIDVTEAERDAQLHRIMFVETNIMLPVKGVAILAAYFFYRYLLGMGGEQEQIVKAQQVYFGQLKFYAAGNIIFWLLLLAAQVGEAWPRILRFSAFWLAMLDNLFLSGLVYFTGGLESVFYWLFVGLMIRSSVDFPVFWQQALLNLSTCFFYTLSIFLGEETLAFFGGELYWLRITILLLVGLCCWGMYVVRERERDRAATQHEFHLRSEKLAATGRLAAEIAHQLKNPLGIINNAAFLLERQLEKNGSAQREPVAIIREEVARSDKILTQLMNYAQLSEGRLENVDINETLERALEQTQPAGLDSKTRVVKQFTSGLPPLAAQRTQLEQCFLNLIKNALEAMNGEGTLTLTTGYRPSGVIEIGVADTGSGIAPDLRERVFEAFFTTKSGGTGLGLAIVKNIVETYGGNIRVSSEPGQGAQFIVALPVRTKSAKFLT